MVSISKQIPSPSIPFVLETKDSFNKPFYTINPTWYNFLYNFSFQAVSTTVGTGMLALDSGTGFLRTLTSGNDRLTITNGTGASDNPTFTVNEAKLSIANTQITGATIGTGSSVTGTNTGDQTITLSGDISGSGTGAITTTIGATKVTNAMLAGSIAATKLVGTDIATVGTITSGTWNGTTIAVANGGTGQTSYTNGQLLIGNTTGNTLTKATLSAGTGISITNGSGSITIAQSATSPIQRQISPYSSATTGTTQIPGDDTIPQNTEGDEYMSVTITPTSSSSILIIEAVGRFCSTTNANICCALFQDSTANAISAAAQDPVQSGGFFELKIRHKMTAGTTSATTFKFRAGPGGAATLTFNGQGGSRWFGGVMNSYIEVTEWAA